MTHILISWSYMSSFIKLSCTVQELRQFSLTDFTSPQTGDTQGDYRPHSESRSRLTLGRAITSDLEWRTAESKNDLNPSVVYFSDHSKAMVMVWFLFCMAFCVLLRGVSRCLTFLLVLMFLAHLSRRLTRWAYSIPMVRPSSSVVLVRRRPHFQTLISLKPVGQS